MIKELIVVEGVNDTKRLQSFFDVDTIETHGLGLKEETIASCDCSAIIPMQNGVDSLNVAAAAAVAFWATGKK